MQASTAPTPIPAVWAYGASSPYVNPIPTPSQQSIKAGAASFADGFPPLCFVPFASGGAGPFGADFNGIIAQVTAGLQWAQAGNYLPWSSSYSTTIGGYANGAIVQSAAIPGLFWRSTADNNTSNPDTGGANWVVQKRAMLGADATFYVASSGGSNVPVGGTSGAPWATPQYAYNTVQALYDTAGYVVTFNCTSTSGSPFGPIILNGPLVGQAGPAAVVWDFQSGSYLNGGSTNAFNAAYAALVTIEGSVVITGANGVVSEGLSFIILNSTGIDFGTCNGAQILDSGGLITATAGYTISGSAIAHCQAQQSNLPLFPLNSGGSFTITLVETPSFTNGFALSRDTYTVQINSSIVSFSGSATGPRYAASGNSVIDTAGGGASFLPGNSSGTLTNNALYL